MGAEGGFGNVLPVAVGAMGSIGGPGGGAVLKLFRGLVQPGSVEQQAAARGAIVQGLAVGLALQHEHLLAVRALVRDDETRELVGLMYVRHPGTLEKWSTLSASGRAAKTLTKKLRAGPSTCHGRRRVPALARPDLWGREALKHTGERTGALGNLRREP